MQKRFTPGGTKILNDQRGNILILGVFLILVISILFAGLVEFGRIMIVREQLQTAADSAALAGAGSGTHRFVKINVITDRGQKVVCGKKTCWCSGCSPIKISNFIGDEKTLIDEGGWRELCVPECSCGGGDCWFELVSRDLMYDTHSMGWGTDPQEIINARNDLTTATQEAISEYCYPYQYEIGKILKNKSLEQISSIVSSSSSFLPHWMWLKRYSVNCRDECYWDPLNYSYQCRECLDWRDRGQGIYNAKIASRKTFMDSIVRTMNNIEQTNVKETPKIDEQYTESAGQFFNANLPKHAMNAGIVKLDVYGFESRNDPRKSKYYPSVVVYAKAKIKTLFPQWFNRDFTTTVCAQGTTAYRDADDQKSIYGSKIYSSLTEGKWTKLPDKACWVDW